MWIFTAIHSNPKKNLKKFSKFAYNIVLLQVYRDTQIHMKDVYLNLI